MNLQQQIQQYVHKIQTTLEPHFTQNAKTTPEKITQDALHKIEQNRQNRQQLYAQLNTPYNEQEFQQDQQDLLPHLLEEIRKYMVCTAYQLHHAPPWERQEAYDQHAEYLQNPPTTPPPYLQAHCPNCQIQITTTDNTNINLQHQPHCTNPQIDIWCQHCTEHLNLTTGHVPHTPTCPHHDQPPIQSISTKQAQPESGSQ